MPVQKDRRSCWQCARLGSLVRVSRVVRLGALAKPGWAAAFRGLPAMLLALRLRLDRNIEHVAVIRPCTEGPNQQQGACRCAAARKSQKPRLRRPRSPADRPLISAETAAHRRLGVPHCAAAAHCFEPVAKAELCRAYSWRPASHFGLSRGRSAGSVPSDLQRAGLLT